MNSPNSARDISVKQEEPEDHLDILQVVVCKEEDPPEQERSPSLLQEEPEPPHIKEEQKEPEPPHIKEEQKEPKPPRIKEERKEPEPPHIKEEQEEILKRPEDGLTLAVKCEQADEDASSHRSEVEVELESDSKGTGDCDDWEETCGGVRSHSHQTQVFSCSECPRSFTSQVFLHTHIRRSHSDLDCRMRRSGQITSSACQQITSSTTSQKQGDTDEPGSYGRHHKCTNDLTRPEGPKAHTDFHNYSCRPDTEKPCHCAHCDMTFSESGQLAAHQRVHTSLRCADCEESFSVLYELMAHQRVHPEVPDLPFHCRLCDKSFPQSSDLKKHQRIHTGEKPFQCKYCDRSFTQSGSLKSHQRIHTGEKPYQCKLCNTSFSRSYCLKTHMIQCVHSPHGRKTLQP